jgi:rubrerythrin
MTEERRAEIAERLDAALKFNSGEISDMMLDMDAGDGQPGLQNCERLCVQARLALEVPWLLAELSRLTDQIAVQNLTNASQAKELIGLYEDRERLTTALTEQAKRFAEREAIYKNQIEGGAQRITALTAALAAREERLWKRWKDAWHEARCGGGVTFRNLGNGNIEYTCKRCSRICVDNPWKEIC